LNPQTKSGDDERVLPVVRDQNAQVRSHRRNFHRRGVRTTGCSSANVSDQLKLLAGANLQLLTRSSALSALGVHSTRSGIR
jgi:hypothetical protein